MLGESPHMTTSFMMTQRTLTKRLRHGASICCKKCEQPVKIGEQVTTQKTTYRKHSTIRHTLCLENSRI
jgi:hypothetical protein